MQDKRENSMNYEIAVKLVLAELKKKLSLDRGIEHYKMMLAFRTGIKGVTKKNLTLNVTPIGLNFEWVISCLEKKKSPYVTIRFTGKRSAELLELAKFDSTAREVARWLAARMLEQGDLPPLELRKFTAQILDDKLITAKDMKSTRGRKEGENLYRNQCIADVIFFLKISGYRPITRNILAKKHNSACDAIVDALMQLRIPLSYDGVKSVWDKYKKLYCPAEQVVEASVS
jgi:hypothetical protein